MKLTVKDRISIAQLCPQKADILTQTIVRDIIKKVELSQAELKKIDFRPRDDKQPGFQWKDAQASKSITFADSELRVLKDQISRLDKDKNVTQDLLSLCIKIRDQKESSCSKNEQGKKQ